MNVKNEIRVVANHKEKIKTADIRLAKEELNRIDEA